jgi:hypothetical protein
MPVTIAGRFYLFGKVENKKRCFAAISLNSWIYAALFFKAKKFRQSVLPDWHIPAGLTVPDLITDTLYRRVL